MKTSKLRKALTCFLVFAMLLTMAPAAFAVQAEETAEPANLSQGYSENPDEYEIYPVPHSVSYTGGQFTPTDTVTVVAGSGVDEYTVDFVEEILTRFGRKTVVASAPGGGTNIVLEIDPGMSVAGKYDPYTLTAQDGTITITGPDTDCVYYGVATLQMMFTSFAGRYLLNVSIADYSDVMFRGFIEGFYGGFTYDGRESQMRSIRDVKGNIYVFASKTDYYHAEGWSELYPDDELSQIAHLVEVGKETKVEYAWSVHTGKGKFFNNASSDPDSDTYQNYLDNLEKLQAKFQQLYDVGVRNFHILNDDYNSGTNADVVALLNAINAWLKDKGDCGPIVYCPKGYNVGWAGNGSELTALQALDDDIYIYWTGSDVNSPINQSNISWPYERSKHYPVTWLNYPCSEHDKSGIYLGDISHYVSDADGLTGQMGIISNPVNYPEANKVAYFQLLSWGWNRDNYTSYMTELWEDCFKYLQPEVYESYLTIARNVSNCPDSGRIPNGFPESEYLAGALDAAEAAALSGSLTEEDARSLASEMNAILDAVADFRANCANGALVAELEPWLKSLESIAEAVKNALYAVISLQSGSVNGAWTYLSNASIALDAWDDNVTPNYSDKKAKAGSLRLQPFASELISYVNEKLLPLLSPDGSLNSGESFYAVLGGVKQTGSANSDKMFDGSDSTYASFSVNQQAGDYYGVDLGTVKTVTSIDILQGQNDTHHDYFHKAALEVSTDGENWTTLVENVNSHHIQVADLNVAARYVRLRLLETGYGSTANYWTNIREFTVTTASSDSGSLVYTSLDDASAVGVNYDGGKYILTASGEVTIPAGGYVGIRLPKIMGINSVDASGALPEGFALQYSANGAVWTDAAGMSATAVRYVRLVNNSGASYTGSIPSISAAESDLSVDMSYVDGNMSVYEGNWGNMVDGNRASLVWTNAKQSEGQYVIYDLGRDVPVYDVTLYFPESGDYPKYLDISIGNGTDPDGVWTSLMQSTDNPDMNPPYRYYSCNGNGRTARYIKLEIYQTAAGWIKFNELEVNAGIEQGADLGAFTGSPEGDFEKAKDGNITTLFAPGEVGSGGGYLEYLISEDSAPSGITILQSPSSVSNAAVKVQTAGGEWASIGTLDKGVTTFDTSGLGKLLALRLEWPAGSSPAIAEIIFLNDGSTGASGEIPALLPNIYEPFATEVEEISVNSGTALGSVGLPAQAQVTLSGGQQLTVPVKWSCASYNAEAAGTYTFTGEYDLDGLGVSNPGMFTLSAQVTVKAASGGTQEPVTGNLALNKAVEVSGVEPNSNTAEANLVDGNTGTRWSAWPLMKEKNDDTPANQIPDVEWAIIDLNTAQDGTEIGGTNTITSVTVRGSGNKAWGTKYKIQVSDDKSDWKTVKECVWNAADTTTSVQENLLDTPATGRYVRVIFQEMNTYATQANSVSLGEIEIQGTKTFGSATPSENLALEGDAYVSGLDANNDMTGDKAVDGNTGTRWTGNFMKNGVDYDSWIVVDLGDDVESISEISMEFYNLVWPTDFVVQVAGNAFTPVDYSTQNIGSNVTNQAAFSGQNGAGADCWTTIRAYTGLSLNAHPTITLSSSEFEAAVPDGTRYIRLYFTGMNGSAAGHSIGLKELTVTGTRTAAPASPDVASVAASTASGVTGSTFSELDLPETVVATLADGTKLSLGVTWNDSGYDSSAASQTLTGALTLPDGVTNSQNLAASLTLTLAQRTAEKVLMSTEAITVKEGVPAGSLPLPKEATVVYSDGTSESKALSWDTDAYKPVPGTYMVSAEVNGSTVSISVKVEPASGGGQEPLQEFTVKFNSNGGSAVADVKVESGSPLAMPQNPVRDGYTFLGWYTDEALTQRWDSVAPVVRDMTLYAAWTQEAKPDPDPDPDPDTPDVTYYGITVKSGENGSVKVSHTSAAAGSTVTITVTPDRGYELDSLLVTNRLGKIIPFSTLGNGRYSFTMPAGQVTVTATFSAASGWTNPFRDVPDEAWYYAAVEYVNENGLMNGIADDLFAPDDTLTRAMLVTILWRMDGEPAVNYLMSFGDVADGAWYAEAVRWAASEGIVTGVSESEFAPNANITREQMAAILYRYAEYKDYDTGASGSLSAFADASSVSAYAQEAMAWAVGESLINGVSADTIQPQGNATRAQVAKVLMLFCEGVAA